MGAEGGKRLLVGKEFSLFKMNGKGLIGREECASLQYMEGSDLLYDIHERLRCVYLRWNSDPDMELSSGRECEEEMRACSDA